MNIIARMEQILKRVLGGPALKPIGPEIRFEDDLGMDLDDMITLELYLEDEYGIAFPGRELMATVGETARYIEGRLCKNSG